ncbi:MAG: Fe2+-dependent dioxygenase [Steroidobacteraceae bacterium]
MFLQIENFLTATEVQSIAQIAGQAKFIDGKRSNPHNIEKQNVIGDPVDPMAQKASQIGFAALQRSEEARNFAFPRRMAAPTLVRYAVGMKYGAHTDAAFLPIGPEPLRSDVSCTIFISNPNDYQGGELHVHLGSEIVKIKGAAGSAVFYASTSVHQVVPVTSGERLVLITFIESQIPDQLQRDLLYTLGEVRALEGLKMNWHNRTQLGYVISNLHRMWAR